MIAQGGKSIYGATVGILMLDARFPRIPGDMGNATSWPFPVHYKIVRDASPDRVVRQGAEGLLDAFIVAAQELETDGVDGITTNCGFLSLYQKELAQAVSIPVATSSLMQVNMVNATLSPGKRAGILTISGSTLTPEHLDAANVPALQANTPDLGAVVLECTNMVPYAADIQAATGLPTYSILSFITWFQSGLTPNRF